MLQDLTEFKFVSVAKLLYYIPKSKCYPTRKMNRVFPDLLVFAQVLKKEIIEPVFDDVFYHIMPTVIGKKTSVAGQITVG